MRLGNGLLRNVRPWVIPRPFGLALVRRVVPLLGDRLRRRRVWAVLVHLLGACLNSRSIVAPLLSNRRIAIHLARGRVAVIQVATGVGATIAPVVARLLLLVRGVLTVRVVDGKVLFGMGIVLHRRVVPRFVAIVVPEVRQHRVMVAVGVPEVRQAVLR